MAWPDAVRRELERQLGAELGSALEVASLRERSEAGGATWRVGDGAGRHAAVVLRRFGPGRGHTQAAAAYASWGIGGELAPARLAELRPASSESVWWIERWVEGRTGAGEVEAVAAALARLHQRAIAREDPLSLASAWRQRIAALHEWLALDFSAAEVDHLTQLAHACLPAEDRQRVASHRDLDPGNWVCDGAGRIWFIDFEHARPDGAAVDLAALRRWAQGEGGAAGTRRWGAAQLAYERSGGEPLPPAELDGADLLWALHTLRWSRGRQVELPPSVETRVRAARKMLGRWLGPAGS